MAFFVPCTTGFQDAVKDPTSPRYLKILIDIDDDDVLEDVTSYLDNNQIQGGGSGQGELGVSTKQFSIRLRNSHQDFADGDFAGAKCAIEAKIGTAEYIRIFTGLVSEEGCQRQKKTKTDDTVTLEMHDVSKTRGMNAKPDPSIYINYKICDTGTPAASIFHQLAYLLGLADADLETATINHTKDYLPLDGNRTAWQELQDLNAQYIGHMCFRYDGKLRFISRHQTGWSDPTSEWTFDGDNIHEWNGKSSPITCNRIKTEFEKYENLGVQVIYKNTDDWDATNERNAIQVTAGAYWPGPNAQDKAKLNYKDPDSGEGFPIGINIQSPTIGSVGSGSDIECEGGTLTLISFNGSTSDTQQNPGSSEIILQNNTGSTITIRKFEVRGTPLRIQKKVTVEYIDSTITDDWDFVDKTVPGKYAVSDTQAHVSTQRWVEFGKVKRKVFDFETDWIPQIQDGAVVTFNPDASINISAVVESYTHDCRGAPSHWKTRISVREKESFTPSGSPQVVEENQGEAAPEMSKKFVTHEEAINGFDNAPSGGTTTPTQVTVFGCEAIGIHSITLWWDIQDNLTNLDHYELQVSSDQTNWYALRNDGVDWKGAADPSVTVAGSPYFTHENIPPGGTEDEPAPVTLYYRVRRKTKAGVAGPWSATISATTKLIGTKDIEVAAIGAAKLKTIVLEALFAKVAYTLTIGFAGTGTPGSPDVGDRRVYLDEDELTIQRWSGSAWVNQVRIGGGSQNTIVAGDDENVFHNLGKAFIGYAGSYGSNDEAAFGHRDQRSTANAAFVQHGDGRTYVNAKTGQRIFFRINNLAIASIDVNGLDMESTKHIYLGDYTYLYFGDSNDLLIGHQAADSVINQVGTGNLFLQRGGSNKLEVKSTGISITGDLTVSGSIPAPPDASISQAKLKTSQGSVSTKSTSPSPIALPGGEYAFLAQSKTNISGNNRLAVCGFNASMFGMSETYTTWGTLQSYGGTAYVYMQTRYVTSSGEIHWVFILRDKITKDILSVWQAPDHPCFGNGGDPELMSHPFGKFDPQTQEIVVINPTKEQVAAVKQGLTRPDGMRDSTKDFIGVMWEIFAIDEVSTPAWPTRTVTVGLPMDCDPTPGEMVQPIKKVIPDFRTQYASGTVQIKSLKEKNERQSI